MKDREAKLFYFLLTYATDNEIKKLKKRQSFHKNVATIKQVLSSKGLSLEDISVSLGYSNKHLASSFAKSRTDKGRYNFGLLIKVLEFLDLPIDPILQRHKKRGTKKEPRS